MAGLESKLTPMVDGYVLEDDKVLLGLRKQTEWGLGKNLIAGIGGKVGDRPEIANETHDKALEREFEEEIGATPELYHRAGQIICLYPHKPEWNQKIAVYIIDRLAGEPVETEAIRPEWYDVNQLPLDQMWDDSQYYLPQVLGGQAVRATFVYGPDNRTVVEETVEVW